MIQRRMVEKWIDLAFMGRFPFPLCEKRKKRESAVLQRYVNSHSELETLLSNSINIY
jgi:hypothetical protein